MVTCSLLFEAVRSYLDSKEAINVLNAFIDDNDQTNVEIHFNTRKNEQMLYMKPQACKLFII